MIYTIMRKIDFLEYVLRKTHHHLKVPWVSSLIYRVFGSSIIDIYCDVCLMEKLRESDVRVDDNVIINFSNGFPKLPIWNAINFFE